MLSWRPCNQPTVSPLEAAGNTWHLYRRLKEVVDDVVVADPTKLKRLFGRGHKTDRNDSSVIAYLAYIGALPTVWVPDEPNPAGSRVSTSSGWPGQRTDPLPE
jgi:hypothetical protein